MAAPSDTGYSIPMTAGTPSSTSLAAVLDTPSRAASLAPSHALSTTNRSDACSRSKQAEHGRIETLGAALAVEHDKTFAGMPIATAVTCPMDNVPRLKNACLRLLDPRSGARIARLPARARQRVQQIGMLELHIEVGVVCGACPNAE